MSNTTIKLPNGRKIQLNNDGIEKYKENLNRLETTLPIRDVWASPHIVVKNSYAELGHSFNSPGTTEEIRDNIDFDATIKIRKYLIKNGFAIAEAMDTAQRFFIGWTTAKKLIEETSQIPSDIKFIAGASYDNSSSSKDLDSICDAVIYQANYIKECGGIPILLPIPFLSNNNYSSDNYVKTYESLINRIDSQLYIHWLGEMFLPELKGYFPGNSFEKIMAIDREKVLGVKLSLLNSSKEISLRNKLSQFNQVVLSGDDFNFCNLIAGDENGFSHALLGIFDAISLPAGIALQFLANGKKEVFSSIMKPCEDLSKIIFESPTQHYKAGLAFLSWLDGHQENNMLINRQDLCRSKAHYLSIIEQASISNDFSHPEIAFERILIWLESNY